jgi:predicted RNase H-like HicB family nuclease
MKAIQYCIYREPPHYVAQCLNVDVSSFGATPEEAVANMKEAVELYLEDAEPNDFHAVEEVMVGESVVHG